MADESPLERLGTAIEEFLRTTDSLEDHAFVTGWVIAASTARVQVEDDRALPMVTGAQYAIGPETSITQAGGLADFLAVVTERAMWSMLRESEEDDE